MDINQLKKFLEERIKWEGRALLSKVNCYDNGLGGFLECKAKTQATYEDPYIPATTESDYGIILTYQRSMDVTIIKARYYLNE